MMRRLPYTKCCFGLRSTAKVEARRREILIETRRDAKVPVVKIHAPKGVTALVQFMQEIIVSTDCVQLSLGLLSRSDVLRVSLLMNTEQK